MKTKWNTKIESEKIFKKQREYIVKLKEQEARGSNIGGNKESAWVESQEPLRMYK